MRVQTNYLPFLLQTDETGMFFTTGIDEAGEERIFYHGYVWQIPAEEGGPGFGTCCWVCPACMQAGRCGDERGHGPHVRELLRTLGGPPHESGWVNYAPFLGRLRCWFCEKPATAAQKAKPKPGTFVTMYPGAVALDGEIAAAFPGELPYGEEYLFCPPID